MNRKHIASASVLAGLCLVVMLMATSCVSLKLVNQRQAATDATTGATSDEGAAAPVADAAAPAATY